MARITALVSGLVLATALSACSTTSAPDATAPQISYPVMTPMDTSALREATTLDVDLYTPQAHMTGCAQRTLPARSPDAALVAALARAQAHSDAHGGTGLMVMQDGAVIHESFADGVDRTTPTVSASMAKSVLALMVGIAIDKGMIDSVDDNLGIYLEEFREDPRGQITFRHALQMAAGLGQTDFMAVTFGADVSAVALQSERAEDPGTQFYYSNAVSQLVLEALDRRARHFLYDGGYAEFLQRELWCPLGNGDAILWVDETRKPRGYAGLHTGLANYLRIGELIRNKGRVGDRQVVSADWIEAMATPSPTNAQYGLHVWLGGEWTAQRRYNPDNPSFVPHAEPFVAKDIVYFDGFGGQRVYILPEDRLVIARYGVIDLTFDDSVIPNALARAVK